MTDWAGITIIAMTVLAMPAYGIFVDYRATNLKRRAYRKQADEQFRQFENVGRTLAPFAQPHDTLSDSDGDDGA